ncbi:MAG: UDP-N-acetylmuramoyl-tripeptide--D-alanyl-D-alanine ligase [Selenomonadaceae bacterium]|nr:UDP-N-acetylmuramoyl-tripeptide--D-alanyl-D-alanine ligase [Selenomonadaceae bacterium]
MYLTTDELLNATDARLVRGGDNNFGSVITDSRKLKSGCLFVALKGDRFNGEDFAIEAINKGAAGVIVSSDCDPKNIPGSGVVLTVDDTLKAYQKLAGVWRSKFDIPIVAITGSNGKTTTKDLTAAVLSSLGAVLKTASNFNNEIGVPQTLFELNENHRAAVIEIGMRGLNQIRPLAALVRPTIGIVTNVGETHIELLGSIENIARAKAELVESIEPGGAVILNADDENVLAMRARVKPGVKVMTFGLKRDADIKGSNLVTRRASTTFTVDYNGKTYDAEIPIIGRHNVSNALAAIGAAVSLGLNRQEIRAGLTTLATTKMRFEIIDRNGLQLINDAYNASPASMRVAINTTAEIAEGRKIAVLGDMLELGELSEDLHRSIGSDLAKHNFSVVVTFGKLGRLIAEGARDAGIENIFMADTHEEAANYLRSILASGDTILFKGSRAMRMEKIIELI